ncbi:MAG: 4Fe-4S dicluster domain-containing protein [Actinomycetota bacterium]
MDEVQPDGGSSEATKVLIDRTGLDQLIAALGANGYLVVGPTVRDSAIVYDEIGSVADLPEGWTDEQDGGHYRLQRRLDDALFGYAVGPQSWKQFLFPPRNLLFSASRTAEGVRLNEPDVEFPYAFVGVRGCELAAIDIQDRVFLGGAYRDRSYAARREPAFIVAVNCGTPAHTCFCVSMGTGPRVGPGFDLALTELVEAHRHVFLVEVGTDRGAQILSSVSTSQPAPGDPQAADAVVEGAAAQMGRQMDTTGIKQLLERNMEHPRWDDVAERCLACGNCTMVCPTCFCSSVEDVTDLAGDNAQRWRRWDSCFTLDFSHVGESSTRSSTKSRYRQWMTHKLGTWIDQFDTSGCVGCGRCITWCPVGIDITEELAAIRSTEEQE